MAHPRVEIPLREEELFACNVSLRAVIRAENQATACTIVTTVCAPTTPCLLLPSSSRSRSSIKYASFVSANYCIYPSRLSPSFSALFRRRRSLTTKRQRPILSSSGYAALLFRPQQGLVACGQLLEKRKERREGERERRKIFCIFHLISHFELAGPFW